MLAAPAKFEKQWHLYFLIYWNFDYVPPEIELREHFIISDYEAYSKEPFIDVPFHLFSVGNKWIL